MFAQNENMNPSIKEFMSQIDNILEGFDKKQLIMTIRNMVKLTPEEDREKYISKIKNSFKVEYIIDESILDHIDDLIKEIIEYTFENDYDSSFKGWNWDEAYLSTDSDLMEDLGDYISEASKIFDVGDFELGMMVYEKLLSIIDMAEGSGYFPPLSDDSLDDLNINEAVLKYIRCVYNCSDPNDQIQKVLDAIYKYKGYIVSHKVFTALDEVSQVELPEYHDFLNKIIENFQVGNSNVTEDLFNDAMILSKGNEGLRDYIKNKGTRNPKSYIALLDELTKKGKETEIKDIAMDGIDLVSKNVELRGKIAEYLIKYAEKKNDEKLLVIGLEANLQSSPSLFRLLQYHNILEKNQNITDFSMIVERLEIINRMKNDVENMGDRKSSCTNRLLAHAMIISHNISKAQKIFKEEDTWHWPNFNSLIISVFLKLLSKVDSDNSTINQLIIDELQSNDRLKKIEIYLRKIDTIQRSIKVTKEDRIQLVKWCEERIIERVDEIVANQKRYDYNYAARLLVALREMYISNNMNDAGDGSVNKIKSKYPRHRNFIADLKSELKKSSY